MSDGNKKPLWSRDYTYSAQISALAYAAHTGRFTDGMTGEALKQAILATQPNIFTDEQLQAFVDHHVYLGSTSKGVDTLGGDAIAFLNTGNQAIQIGVAGVNDDLFGTGVAARELTQTDLQTFFYGANREFRGRYT